MTRKYTNAEKMDKQKAPPNMQSKTQAPCHVKEYETYIQLACYHVQRTSIGRTDNYPVGCFAVQRNGSDTGGWLR